MIRHLLTTAFVLVLCASCATTDETIEVSKKVVWSISVADFDQFDVNGDGKLTPAELVPSINEKILPVAMEFFSTRIPPGQFATKEDMRKAMEATLT
jgi:hypothetical protein